MTRIHTDHRLDLDLDLGLTEADIHEDLCWPQPPPGRWLRPDGSVAAARGDATSPQVRPAPTGDQAPLAAVRAA